MYSPETIDERNAQVYEQYEAWVDAEADAREYDGPAADAQCYRCGDWGVEWNVEVQQPDGSWAIVCTDCEGPEDWPSD